MWERLFSSFYQYKLATTIVSLTLLIALWYLFRPELLFIDKKVNESPPFETTAEPLETGLFSGNLHGTSGRATIYRQSDGMLILRLSDFRTSNGPDVHVVLARPSDPLLQGIQQSNAPGFVELGALKGNEGGQDYVLPAVVDVNKYSVVSIFCERFHAVFGSAKLEPF